MTPPFLRLQQRLNGAVIGRLANALASIGNGESFAVLFENTYVAEFGQMDALTPVCTGSEADLGHLVRDDLLTIAGTAYRVQRVEPDGLGMVRLYLYQEGA